MPVRGDPEGALIPRNVPEEGGRPNPVVARCGAPVEFVGVMPVGLVGVLPAGLVGVLPAGFVGVIPAGLVGVLPVMPAAKASPGAAMIAATNAIRMDRAGVMAELPRFCAPRHDNRSAAVRFLTEPVDQMLEPKPLYGLRYLSGPDGDLPSTP